jgi:dihydropyrimidinase
MIDKEGVPSFKVFMAYKGVVQADDETLMRTLLLAGEHGGLTMVHAENGDAIHVIAERFAAEGKLSVHWWPRSRPPELEGEAANRAIVLAGLANAPLYIVHTSCSYAVEAIARARENGQHVYGETCPQYLMRSIEDYDEPGTAGAKYVCAPPLREKWHQDVLWRALAAGTMQTVATDHSAWPIKGYKEHGMSDFRTMIQGAPGIEERVVVLYTYGVTTGRLSLNRFVEVTSTAPARLFGLYPQKGDIAIGSDADIVVWDPNVEWTLGVAQNHGNTDYSLFEGLPVKGRPALVLSRGRVVVRDREYVGGEGGGRFLHRAPFTPS